MAPESAYSEQEILFPSQQVGVQLAATLSLPAQKQPRLAIVLVTGSGAHDRGDSIFGHKPFEILAAHLVQHGIAVLRYDDRGVGGSSGTPDGTTADFAVDAESALDYLQGRQGLADVPIGILGHSEGGVIGTLVAARRSEVAFVIALAAPALPGTDILRQQTKAQRELAGRPAREIERNDRLLVDLIDAAISDDPARLLSEALQRVKSETGENDGWVTSNQELFGSPWMRHFLAFDPRPTLRRLKVPILMLYGERDVQVLPKPNASAAKQALAGNSHATVGVVKGVNHLFQTAPTGAGHEYAHIAEAISPKVLSLVSEWLADLEN